MPTLESTIENTTAVSEVLQEEIDGIKSSIFDLEETKNEIQTRVLDISITKMDEHIDTKLAEFVQNNQDPDYSYQINKAGVYGVSDLVSWAIDEYYDQGTGPEFTQIIYSYTDVVADPQLTDIVEAKTEFDFGYDWITHETFDGNNTTGSYGLDEEISALNAGLDISEANLVHVTERDTKINNVLSKEF